ncbi:unnamed protein product, partial [Pylaiella littoralis]
SGELHECRGCSLAKGLRKPIARSTHTRAPLPHIIEEGEPAEGEGEKRGGASSQG